MTNFEESIAWALGDVVLKLGEIKAEVVELTRERDEARAKLRSRRAAFDVEVQKQNELRMQAEAEVERLRAAQQLPDVGPVTRDTDGTLLVDGITSFGQPQGGYRRNAARHLAMATFLDAEADDISSDDKDPVYEAVAEVLDEAGWDEATVDGIASEVSTRLRARGGQEPR